MEWLGYSDILVLVSFALLVLGRPAQASEDFKTFVSKVHGYAVHYPANWYLEPVRHGNSYSDPDNLNIDNFPPMKAVVGIHLPPDGAEIELAPSAAFRNTEAPQSVEDWVSIRTAHEDVIAKRTFDLRSSRGKLSIVEVRTKEDIGGPALLEAAEWYFQINGRLFAALLTYWQGDPKTDNYLQTLKQIVLSLNVTQ